jgi:hypothetical protein
MFPVMYAMYKLSSLHLTALEFQFRYMCKYCIIATVSSIMNNNPVNPDLVVATGSI